MLLLNLAKLTIYNFGTCHFAKAFTIHNMSPSCVVYSDTGYHDITIEELTVYEYFGHVGRVA